MNVIGVIMNITLGSEFESRIAKKVKSGLYTSASEVIRESLRLLFEKDLIREKQIKMLQEKISLGFSQIESGNYTNENIMDIFQQVVDNGNQTKL